MKLITPAWRSAWYEEGLSERFAQEMTRLEKTTVRDLGTSAQWVEQMVIELGQLTQNMIHLEGEVPRPPQVRLAVEKALKLAALGAHLAAALDQALEKGPAVFRYSQDQGAPTPVPSHLATGSPFFASTGNPEAARGASFAAALAQSSMPQPFPAAPPAQPPPSQQSSLRVSPQVQVGLQRQSAAPPPHAPAPAPSVIGRAPLMSPLMDISQPLIPDQASPMREMILALSRRGLSRSEIEVITEQPRHIIEAVLATT